MKSLINKIYDLNKLSKFLNPIKDLKKALNKVFKVNQM